MSTTPNQTIDGAISTAIRQRLGMAPLGTAHAVRESLADAGFEIVPMTTLGAVYVLTPEGEDLVRKFVDGVSLTQDEVTAGGEALEREIEGNPDRYFLLVGPRGEATPTD